MTDDHCLHALPKVTRGYDTLRVKDGGQNLTDRLVSLVGGTDEPARCRDKKQTPVPPT